MIITAYGHTSWTITTPDAYTDLSQTPAWCSFYGVTCGTSLNYVDYQRVVDINLNDIYLTGTLPAINHLGRMSTFDISNNAISGTIPESLSKMTRLRSLIFSRNELIGTIPSSLGSLTSLGYLQLEYNKLSGTIPSSLCSSRLPLLKLDLGNNQLRGAIPSSLGSLPRLVDLRLHNNKLSGTIPSSLGRLTKLYHMMLHNNNLSGTIPILDLKYVDWITLNDNYLTMGSLAEVPPSTFSVKTLQSGFIKLLNNCLKFRNPYQSYQNADATHCKGELPTNILQSSIM